MRLYTDGLSNYEPWSGAVDFYNEIVNAGKLDELEFALDEMYPEGMSETELNDLLWHDEDWLRGFLDMDTEEKEDSYVYAIEDTRGLPQCGCETRKFEDWGEIEEYLEENPDVNKRIQDGYAQIVEL